MAIRETCTEQKIPPVWLQLTTGEECVYGNAAVFGSNGSEQVPASQVGLIDPFKGHHRTGMEVGEADICLQWSAQHNCPRPAPCQLKASSFVVKLMVFEQL